MALEHPRLLAASLTAAILGTACSTPSDSSTPANGAPANANEGMPVAGLDDITGQPGTAGAQDPMSEKVQAERRAALVQNYIATAQSLRGKGELRAAKMELLKAKELNPNDDQVRTILASVQAELGEPEGLATTYGEEAARLREIGEQRMRANVEMQLQKAAAAMSDRNFAGALEELRIAALTIELKDQVDWQDLPGKVQAAKAEADKAYDAQQRETQNAQNAELAERLRQEFQQKEARRRAQVDALLQESQVAFEARRFSYAQELAYKALQIEPQNSIAYEMHTASTKAVRDQVNEEYFQQRAKAMRAMLEADEELKVPQTSILELDAEVWDRANRRAGAGKRLQQELDPMDQAVWDKVRTEQVGKLTYTEETGEFLDVVNNLKLITGVNILVTPEAREVVSSESLKVVIELVGSLTLNDFLNHMVGRSQNLAWTVKNGVVLIGNKSQAAGTLRTEIYSVKDLVFKRTQFVAPTIRDIPSEEQGDVPRTGGEGEDPVAYIEVGDLVNNLKDATDPTYWESEGVDLRAEETGFIAVTASPEMHDRILLVLNDMRRFATPIVTIDSKFLTISRNFLQEVGVDFRGLGGSGNKGTTVALDDVTNGLQNNASRGLDNGGTGDPAGNPLAGAFFNDGGDGDVRARTEHFFANDLGRALSPSGGVTFGWTLLGDTELNMILRAVEKQQNGEVVNSQILSVLNHERGHVAVINQTAYVRDFDVEVAQASFIADPKVDVIQDGFVLDVQPVVQHDRKYVTLNLNPTVAELTRPIPTFTTSLAGSTLPVTLQLPNLTVTNFSTTVKVPDGGTVLLGGLRQMLTKERRAEIPFLSSLPILSFFFKQEGSVDENRSLMVMVRAQITDLQDTKVAGK